MVNSLPIFNFEGKRFLGKWHLIAFGAVFLLMLYYSIIGIDEYNALKEKEIKFKEIQDIYFKTTPNYEGYGMEGIKSLYISSPAGIFFRNSIIPIDFYSKINSIVSLNLKNNIKGKSLNPGNLTYEMDFSGIVLFILTVFALYYGYASNQNREFLKSLGIVKSPSSILYTTIISRYIFFALSICVLFFSQILFIKICGVNLSSTDFSNLSGYLLETLLMLFFFFLMGFIIGTFRLNGFAAFFFMFAVWFSFIFIIPGIVNSIIEVKTPDAIEDYKTELEKFKIVTDFEKRAVREYGEFERSNIEKSRKVIEGYWNNDYKKIEALEEKLKNEHHFNIKVYNKIAIFTPVTFYLLTSNEVSSRGYNGFIMFYTYQQEQKRRFVRFYIDRTFYNDPKVMVNFIKENENLYYATSQLPEHFGIGVLINMGYIIILLFASYFRFKKSMFPIPKETIATHNVNIDLEKGKIFTVHGEHPEFFKLFINALFGKTKAFKGKIKIDGKDIGTMEKKPFLYLPHPDNIPDDIKTRDLLRLFKRLLKMTKNEFSELKTSVGKENLKKRFADLKITDKANILLLIVEMNKCKTYVFYNFAFYLPKNFRIDLPERVSKLILEDTMVIDLVSKGDLWIESDKYFNINMKNKTYYVATVVKEEV